MIFNFFIYLFSFMFVALIVASLLPLFLFLAAIYGLVMLIAVLI